MAADGPRVFTIPAGIPFARALARGVVASSGSDPLALADALIFVPTRRAVRALREAFAETLGGAALLPRIRALGDADEEELLNPSTDDLAAPPAIAPLRRRLLLATLVQRWSRAKGAPVPFAQAAGHAAELAHFLDETVTQGTDLAELRRLVPDSLAAHWQDVLKFLEIIAESWPELLAAEGAIEPAAHRDARLRALARKLAAAPSRGPVIAAGSTGSIPATAELLKTIAYLANGAVVLPGLDADLGDSAWDMLDPGHAQFGLRQLLDQLGVTRKEVVLWPHLPESYAGRRERTRFLAEALRPPPATDSWRDLVENARGEFAQALKDFAQVAAANPREEALVIACALREALECENRTAALVTPDRNLARRVAAELSRWDVTIDDSAGVPLSATPPGAFLSLLARSVAEDFAPVSFLALLKHPLAAGGENRASFRHRTRELEIAALRGLRPDPGLHGIAERLQRGNGTSEPLRRWFEHLARLFEPLADLMKRQNANLNELARAHALAAEALAAGNVESGTELLWRGPAGEAAANFMNELMRDGERIALDDGREYADLFLGLARERAVRPPYASHPRLAILGPLEARLLDFDLVVLGGLNEGNWPAEATTDPFLSRPMREKLGLEPPERRTGLSAHDFAMLSASRTVLLTRSLKEDGAPTVPSRWLLRVEQLANGLGEERALHARDGLLEWVRAIDRGAREARCRRPSPRPPVSARPRTLSVTEIEAWLRDPYAIYAKHVLGLRPLEALEMDAGPAERGVATHKALERFLKAFPAALPADGVEQLMRMGEDAFLEAGATAAIMALWRPRFERAARWFLEFETGRRQKIARSAVEVSGSLALPAREAFTLRGRADRIDFFADGSAAVLDYKTGRAPTDTQMAEFKSPQLPLEAAMLMHGAFDNLHAGSIRELVHVRLTGSEPAGEEKIAKIDADVVSEQTFLRLLRHIDRYLDPAQGYRSREMPLFASDTGDYDHLARVREWSFAGESEE